jgi:uncharacterized membrane protein YesL
MGLFSRNYNRPGPGVRKDEPRKKGFARFFELIGRDFGDLVKLNVMFSICAFPTFAVFLLGVFGYFPGIAFLFSLLLAFPVGGALVAYVYYISKMMRDDPSYVWFEFKRKFAENYKQAAPAGMLCTAFVYAQIMLWGSLLVGEPEGDIVWLLIALLSLLIFGMITPYIFMHFAYVDLKTFKVIKNSVLLSFGYLPRSFMGATLGGLMWMAFALYFPISVITVPLIILFGVSVSMVLCLMWVWPPFNKHFNIEETLINRLEGRPEEEQPESDESE